MKATLDDVWFRTDHASVELRIALGAAMECARGRGVTHRIASLHAQLTDLANDLYLMIEDEEVES